MSKIEAIKERSRSLSRMEEARRYSPGGVHSSIRKELPFPMVFERAEGATIWDVDGNRYIDYNAAFAAAILGYAHPRVDQQVFESSHKLNLIGLGSNEYEIELAKKIVEYVPSAEMVGICNTGSEATHHCIRLSRAVTGRMKIIKFQGCYHGWHDYVLMNVMSSREKVGQKDPLSAGMLPAAIEHTTVLDFNDLDAVERELLTKEYACLIIEPIAHNMGCVMMTDKFAHGLRELCDQTGTILIFDEVITGFRHGLGGYQAICGITPDLTPMGKAISNGYPLAAVGGKRELMMNFSPGGGKVYFSGTHNAHPVGVVAGAATIAELEDGKVYEHLYALGERMRQGFEDIAARLGIPMVVAGYGSIFVPFFMDPELGMPQNYTDLLRTDMEMDRAFRMALIEHGIMFYPLPFRRNCLMGAHTEEDVDFTLQVAEDVLRDLR
ncbi:MAG: aspartate aminotransferase family protein [Anaerolineales bacterium]|nr:aspartate aminotransferase family protein [Anaerolineales bacterium]